MSDGKIQKGLRGRAVVGQSEEFISYCYVLFDLLSEGAACFSELELDELPLRIAPWLADPSISLHTLHGLDR